MDVIDIDGQNNDESNREKIKELISLLIKTMYLKDYGAASDMELHLDTLI